MNVDKLKADLELDEGVKYEIYLDHLGLPTFGIGHLIKDIDPEFGLPVGTPVSAERVTECFNNDISTVLDDCDRLYPGFQGLPEEVQLVLSNMMFNLGYPRLSKFKKLHAAVESCDWQTAAKEMTDSKWYRQVPNRAERLVQRMKSV